MLPSAVSSRPAPARIRRTPATCGGRAVVTGAHERQQLEGQVEPGGHHRLGLQRLQRRPGIAATASGSPTENATAPSAPRATTEPKWMHSSKPLRRAIAIGAWRTHVGRRAHVCGRRRRRGGRGGLDPGEVAVDDVVAVSPFGRQRLHHRRAGEGEDRAGRSEQRGAAERRPERDRRVQLHRAGGDLRREEVVLDLLVDDDEPEHDRRLERGVEERDQHRQDARDVRADDGKELADQADPQRERYRRRDARRLEHDPVEQRRQHRQQRPRVQVAAGLGDRQLPRRQHLHLACRAQAAADRTPQPRAVGDEVVREEQHREDLQQDSRARRRTRRTTLSCWPSMNRWTAPLGSLNWSMTSWASISVSNVSLMKSTVSVMYVSEFDSRSATCVPTSVPIAPTKIEQHHEHAEQDRRRGSPSTPAATRQAVDARFDREREEQRDDEDQGEPAELLPQVADDEREQERHPEQHDARKHPSGKAVDPEVFEDRRLLLDQRLPSAATSASGSSLGGSSITARERTHGPCHDGQMPSDSIRDWLADQVRSRVVGSSRSRTGG